MLGSLLKAGQAVVSLGSDPMKSGFNASSDFRTVQ